MNIELARPQHLPVEEVPIAPSQDRHTPPHLTTAVPTTTHNTLPSLDRVAQDTDLLIMAGRQGHS